MSSLSSYIIDSLCDIQTAHSYVPVYEQLFSPIRDNTMNVLQIGAEHGAMLKTWFDYFPNAKIYGVDSAPADRFIHNPFFVNDVNMYAGIDYNDPTFIANTFTNAGITFDIIIDDCSPRELDLMTATATAYMPLLKAGGMYFCEDLKYAEWGDALTQTLPAEMQANAILLDRRSILPTYDDILWYVTK